MRGLTAQLRRLSTVRFVRVESFPKQGKRSAKNVRRVNLAKRMVSRTARVAQIKVSITRTIRSGLDRALMIVGRASGDGISTKIGEGIRRITRI